MSARRLGTRVLLALTALSALACDRDAGRPPAPSSPARAWPRGGPALDVVVTGVETYDSFVRSHTITLYLDVRAAGSGRPAPPPAHDGVALTIAGRYEPARITAEPTGGRDVGLALVWPGSLEDRAPGARELLAGADLGERVTPFASVDRAVAWLLERALEPMRRRVVLVVTDVGLPATEREILDLAGGSGIELRTIRPGGNDPAHVAAVVAAEVRAIDAELVVHAVLPDDLPGYDKPVDLVVELRTPDGAFGMATVEGVKLPRTAIE